MIFIKIMQIQLAVPGPQESGEEPGRREIGIEHERSVEHGDAAGDVLGEVGERMPAPSERDRIVPAQVDGPARQAGALGDLAWAKPRSVEKADRSPAPSSR